MSSRSLPSRGFQRLATAAAAASLLVIAVGGAVRATDSGLACPTWPGCFSGGDFLPPADLNVWLEHTHRLLAGGLALLIAALTLWVLVKHRSTPGLLWPVLLAAVAVNVQAILGALVVLNLLQAELVTTHLGLGTAVMALLLYLAVRSRRPVGMPAAQVPRQLSKLAAAVAVLVWVQILLGGHLTGVGGGLAFADDPALGLASVAPIDGEGALFNVLHRAGSLVVAAAVMILAARVRRSGVDPTAARLARAGSWLVVLQIAIGVANLASELSFLAVIPHLAVASWILACIVLVALVLARPPGPTDHPTPIADPAEAEMVPA